MRKILILSFLLALSAGLMAQRASSTTALNAATLKNLTMLPVDSITQGATAYWTFDVNRANSYFYSFAIAIDTITHGNNRLSVTVWGSMDNTNWVSSAITQVNVFPTAGGGADTTLQMSAVTTPVLWRYLKLRFVSLDANVVGSRIKSIGLKVGDAHK